MKHPIHIVRPVNLLLIVFTMFVVVFKYRDETNPQYWLQAFYLIAAATLTAAAGYVINEIKDIDTDAINKPNDCIVGKSMSKTNAWLLYGLLSTVSLFVAYLFSEVFLMLNLCITVILYLYAYMLKGMPLIGNIMVAVCSAAVIACCILLISFETEAAGFNFLGYIVFAFVISLIREIVKDIQDIEGDQAVGLKTYPIVFGITGAKIMIYILTGIEIVVCALYAFLAWGFDLYLASIFMGLITVLLLLFINHISKTHQKHEFQVSSKWLKYIMFAGVITLIFA